MDAETRSDLEGMLVVARENWTRTDCMQMCLATHLCGNKYGGPAGQEWMARPFRALGFPSLKAGYDWNDTPGRTREEVVRLIESTLSTI